MYTISQTTKSNIEREIGTSLENIRNMTATEEQNWIEIKQKSEIRFSKKRRYGIIGRGNPLIARKKIRTLKDIEKKSSRLFGL